jgi:hypothetical protein
MSASALLLQTESEQTLGSFLAQSHDRSMAQCDRMLGPVMDPNATFVERWGALRFVSEQLQERCGLEQKLLGELQPLLPPHVWDQLQHQAGQVVRYREDVERLARGRCTARDLAQAAQELVQALRLWYAEIEFGLGDLRWRDLSRRASELLKQLNYRPGLNSRS